MIPNEVQVVVDIPFALLRIFGMYVTELLNLWVRYLCLEIIKVPVYMVLYLAYPGDSVSYPSGTVSYHRGQ